MARDFLVEIGTEELPPTSLKTLAKSFLEEISSGLCALALKFDDINYFATPRRLAVIVRSLEENTPVKESKVWGAPAKIAFNDDGTPGKAAEAFAKKYGLSVDQVKTEHDGKQEKLVHLNKTGGDASAQLLSGIVNDALTKLPISKRMRWGSSRSEFVRPVKWIVMLFGDQIIDTPILGVTPSNISFGHRFHSQSEIKIDSPQNYVDSLKQEKVLADYQNRQDEILRQVNQVAKEHGGQAVIDDDLLDEVTSLVEWPNALCGKFDASFLRVPAEALISSMKEHQKYFHMVDDTGALMPCFITVSNIESTQPEKVIDGNERVIRPRLADAAFFFDTDKKVSLEVRREKLKSVVFQAKLGTIYDKTERIKLLAIEMAEQLGADTSKVARAAEICKSDLVTNMVYEFTDLQGLAGYHYAVNDGEDNEVALAMNEQYMPRFAGDQLGTTTSGNLLALADRLDTITGIFGIGQKPSGSKDPFALRRASLGALRILVEKNYALDLKQLIQFAAENFVDLPEKNQAVDNVINYMLERFKAWYEEDAIPAEVFQSVNAKGLTVPMDIDKRIHAVAAFCKLPQAQALAAANKRVSNILNKLETDPPTQINDDLLQESAEKNLAQNLLSLKDRVFALVDKKEYTQALSDLARLREPIDDFFDHVMVMTEDENVKNNRLALLHQLRELFLNVADISYLATK